MSLNWTMAKASFWHKARTPNSPLYDTVFSIRFAKWEHIKKPFQTEKRAASFQNRRKGSVVNARTNVKAKAERKLKWSRKRNDVICWSSPYIIFSSTVHYFLGLTFSPSHFQCGGRGLLFNLRRCFQQTVFFFSSFSFHLPFILICIYISFLFCLAK